MRFLIFFKGALLRHFESSLLEVARRGHELVLVSPHDEIGAKIPASLVDHPSVSLHQWKSRGGPLEPTLAVTRHARDYLRYLDPRLKDAWANRDRAWNRLVSAVSQGSRSEQEIARSPWIDLTSRELEVLGAAFEDIEMLVPPDPTLCDLLIQQRADAVLVTPLITFGSGQADVVRACQATGVPCGLLVFSWDNLSNKGVMHVRPDRVFVWNEVQAREAVELHGVLREHVVVTGAPRFDDFFELAPSRGRDAELLRRGLDPSRPLILYLGSSPFVAEDEPRFVDLWLDAVRASKHEVVREANVLIRSHPRARAVWEAWSPDGRENVALNSRTAILGGRRLYDELAHCDAVVGLNTSAEIEAAIVGKPLYTVDAGELAPGQEGSTHFRYILRENGGCVEHATSIEQHLDQLAAGLTGGYDRQAIADFVASFVRPHGIDKPVTPILANAIIEMAISRPEAYERDPYPGPSDPEPALARSDAPPEAVRLEHAVDAVPVAPPKPPAQWDATSNWTVGWLERNIRPGDIFYEIDAGVGTLTMHAARLVGDGGLVVAFERSVAKYARLCESVTQCRFEARVLTLPFRLSSTTGVQSVPCSSGVPRHGRFHATDETDEPARPCERHADPTLCVRLDDAVKSFDLPLPTLLRIDVEHGSFDTLAGALNVLGNAGVRGTLITIDRNEADRVVPLLASELGFRLHAERRDDHAGTWSGELVRT